MWLFMHMFYPFSRQLPAGAVTNSLVNPSGTMPAPAEAAVPRLPGRTLSRLARMHSNTLLLLVAVSAALSICLHVLTPMLATSLAEGLPASWVRTSSERILAGLDQSVLVPSTISPGEQEALRQQFAELKPAPKGTPPYRLLFRGSYLANAPVFSLPGGEIIVTDAFMAGVTDQNERLAMLCHELGHLYHRHALRGAIELQLPRLAWAAFLGSSSASIDALSAGLQQLQPSRAHILEADRYAASMLRANQLPNSVLAQAIEHEHRLGKLAGSTASGEHGHFFNERLNMLQNFR